MRAEFSQRTKVIAWVRSGGNCEGCTAKLYPGKYEFHHRLECAFAGTSELDNLQVLCVACHSAITGKRAPVIAKSNRVRAKHIGVKKPRSIRTWKRFNGSPVRAPRER
jgi:hypothetical protein